MKLNPVNDLDLVGQSLVGVKLYIQYRGLVDSRARVKLPEQAAKSQRSPTTAAVVPLPFAVSVAIWIVLLNRKQKL